MTPRHFNVLFLCTGNSARSIMAEVIMNRKGFPNFTGYSAGSRPTGQINPQALKQITSAGLPVEGLRSKSWNEFEKPDAPKIHFVFNLCDRAEEEPCPVWPSQPLTARWSIPDPAAATGTDEQIQRAYFEAWRTLDRRIALFICLPLETLERDVMQREIDQIGRS
jgi:arsenate reductase